MGEIAKAGGFSEYLRYYFITNIILLMVHKIGLYLSMMNDVDKQIIIKIIS